MQKRDIRSILAGAEFHPVNLFSRMGRLGRAARGKVAVVAAAMAVGGLTAMSNAASAFTWTPPTNWNVTDLSETVLANNIGILLGGVAVLGGVRLGAKFLRALTGSEASAFGRR